jgi:hypothetical protein
MTGFYVWGLMADMFLAETQDSLSDDALLPLRSYKYSSVDKSFISRYILKHYVWQQLI